MTWLFISGSQSIGASASASVLPMDIPVQKHQFFGMHSAFFMAQHSHLYMTTGKIIALTIWIFVSKVMSLLFNMLSRFVQVFLPRSKHLLSSWLQFPCMVCSDIYLYICMYIYLNHFPIYLKLILHCNFTSTEKEKKQSLFNQSKGHFVFVAKMVHTQMEPRRYLLAR